MTSNPTTKASDHKLVISREFNAPRDLVWKAWITPEQIKEWLAPGEGAAIESVRIDLRVGGKYRLQQRMADGEYYTAAGTYLEVKAPERLVYTFDWEKDGAGTEFGELEGNETRMTLEFHARGDRTGTRVNAGRLRLSRAARPPRRRMELVDRPAGEIHRGTISRVIRRGDRVTKERKT